MKTPRQILLDQNQQFDSRLETIQHDVIKNSVAAEVTRLKLPQQDRQQKLEPRHLGCYGFLVENIWNRIFLPARRIWLTYAFIWIAIATFYIATADHSTTRTAKITNPTEAVANWKEQQIVLVELLKPTTAEPADRPKTQQMRPRSEANHIAIG